jgi:hypothetical protein
MEKKVNAKNKKYKLEIEKLNVDTFKKLRKYHRE